MGGTQRVILLTLMSIVFVGLIVFFIYSARPTEILLDESKVPNTAMRFGIFGAVQNPGYYSCENYIRVEDAVALAGGLTDDADEINSHLARWIEDGETVLIPTVSPIQPTLTLSVEVQIERIDLNTADKDTLMSLPGIGEKRASDILSLREQKGRFEKVEDLLEISGISEKLLESIYDYLIIQ